MVFLNASWFQSYLANVTFCRLEVFFCMIISGATPADLLTAGMEILCGGFEVVCCGTVFDFPVMWSNRKSKLSHSQKKSKLPWKLPIHPKCYHFLKAKVQIRLQEKNRNYTAPFWYQLLSEGSQCTPKVSINNFGIRFMMVLNDPWRVWEPWLKRKHRLQVSSYLTVFSYCTRTQ